MGQVHQPGDGRAELSSAVNQAGLTPPAPPIKDKVPLCAGPENNAELTENLTKPPFLF